MLIIFADVLITWLCFFFKDKNEEWPVDDGGEYRLSPRLTSEAAWYM